VKKIFFWAKKYFFLGKKIEKFMKFHVFFHFFLAFFKNKKIIFRGFFIFLPFSITKLKKVIFWFFLKFRKVFSKIQIWTFSKMSKFTFFKKVL